MGGVVSAWRTWKHGRKFTQKGKGCKFPHKYLEVDGHVELGNYCRFRNNVIMRTHGEGKIQFGDRVGLSYYVIIEATNLIKVGTLTGIAEFTVIRDSNHMFYGTDAHWRQTPLITQPIIIGDHCFIGSRCYIMPGVTIGDGAVIHAGSVVARDVGPYEIWAGAPARRVAHRTKNIPIRRQREFEELVAKHGMKEDRYVDSSPPESAPSQQEPPDTEQEQ